MKDKRFNSVEPMYSQGAALVALGKALQDKRSRIDELAELAFDAGLRLQFRIVDSSNTTPKEGGDA